MGNLLERYTSTGQGKERVRGNVRRHPGKARTGRCSYVLQHRYHRRQMASRAIDYLSSSVFSTTQRCVAPRKWYETSSTAGGLFVSTQFLTQPWLYEHTVGGPPVATVNCRTVDKLRF